MVCFESLCKTFYCCPIKLKGHEKVWLERCLYTVRVIFLILQAPLSQKVKVEEANLTPPKASIPTPFLDY